MENKVPSVIIVGGGPIIKGTKLGTKIDAYDVVIRCNNYEIAGFEEDVGTKTNIWVVNTSRSTMPRDCAPFTEVWFKEQPIPKLLQKLDGPGTLQKCRKMLDPAEWNIQVSVGDNPSVGFRGIMQAAHLFGRVAVTGFTFFLDGDGKYFNHYYLDQPQQEYYKRYFIEGDWAKDEEEKTVFKEALDKKMGVVRGAYHSGQSEKDGVIELAKSGHVEIISDVEHEFFGV